MKKIINIFLISISLVLFQSCEQSAGELLETSLKIVTFGSSSYSTGVDVGGTQTVNVTIYTSSNVSSETTFNITADGSGAGTGSYDVPSSVSIPAGSNSATLAVVLSDSNLGIGINTLELEFTDVASGYTNGAATTISYTQNCTEVTGTLDINFDRWGSEVNWEIRDALNGVVASTGGYPDTGSGTTTSDSISITLCAGRDYTLFVSDGYGDGWGTGSSYTLTIGGVVKVTGDASGLDPTGVSTAFDTN